MASGASVATSKVTHIDVRLSVEEVQDVVGYLAAVQHAESAPSVIHDLRNLLGRFLNEAGRA